MADEEYNPFPNQAPATPPPPPAWVPTTPLDHAAVAFVASLTKTQEQPYLTIEVSKAGLREAVVAFVETVLADPKLNPALPQGDAHAA